MTEPLSPDQIFIRKLSDIVLTNLENENFGVNDLARLSGISIYKLGRKLNSINGKTVNQLIREIRLQKALEMLHTEEYTIAEVAYKSGFGSPAYFSKCFHDFFGYSPGEARKMASNNHLPDDPDQPVAKESPVKTSWKYIITFPGLLILVMMIGAGSFLIYKKIHKQNWPQELVSSGKRISVAVMPFRNMTNDTLWNTWQYAIQEGLISTLSSYNKELIVRQKNSINDLIQSKGVTEYASISSNAAGKFSQILGVNLFIYGSIEKSGTSLRFVARLINAKNKEILKTFSIARLAGEKYAFEMIDSLSQQLKDFLLISKLIDENPLYGYYPLATTSPEALRFTIYGDKAFKRGDNRIAISWYLKAVEIDSNYFDPMMGLSSAYAGMGNLEEDLRWVVKYYKKRDQFPLVNQLWASWAYAYSFEPPEEGIKYLKQLLQVDDQNPGATYILGITYKELGQYDKAISEFEKSLMIYHKWGKSFLKDNWNYSNLGHSYHKAGQYKKEKAITEEWEKYNRGDPNIIPRWIAMSLAEKDTIAANRYIKRFISACKEKWSSSEAELTGVLGLIYSEEPDIIYLDKAEEYYRKALSLEPDNPRRMNTLVNFLIENNRNLNEVSGLMDKAMALGQNKIDYCNYSNNKGWGLFKQGKNQEALEVLQKTWDEAPFKLYSIKSHLDEVKKTLSQNIKP